MEAPAQWHFSTSNPQFKVACVFSSSLKGPGVAISRASGGRKRRIDVDPSRRKSVDIQHSALKPWATEASFNTAAS